ncbi:uncharacterized protein Z518_08462 [Rhinocladiella mackenziei CBS 650.93]|uniref:BZIP domain-containing protein n=1 Tax=Rhinocladiella mackenziei CBS 650.93 TaxID=1442369 RepID=A0A0D2IGX7_9EURO|nr:uncharacterized protein Z518_08462 [Rhinocladiella mackenziei CBS 650.93]KIX02521.1 hypothetical protein Z518_08462 [Rhinocladiella mackenziei CBS 650.93]
MPTLDPIKRRKQNCENQKRWRQRQIDELRRLTTALDKSNSHVKVLEVESGQLRGALRNALAEISRLRKANGALKRQVQNSLSQVRSPSKKTDREWGTNYRLPVMFPENQRPMVELIEVDGSDSSKNGLASKKKQLLSGVSGSDESDGDWKSIVIMDEDDEENEQDELFEQARRFETTRERTSYLAGHKQAETPSGTESFALDDDVVEYPQILIDDTTVPDLHHRNGQGEGALQEVDGVHPGADPIYFNWPTDSILGGTGAIWQRMTNFPDTTRISKHILAVQNVLSGAFAQLIQRPSVDCERIVAETFAWLIRSAWPSCESCFKMMTVYRHIYLFELFRSFPCPVTYNKLHPFYRPTALQLTVPHSPAIDWLPWPAMRDRVIQMQNQTNVDVDQLCLASLEHTVIEPEPSFSSGADQGPDVHVTFRIWDMYLLERAGGGSFPSTSMTMTHNPASPDLQALAKVYNLPFQDITRLRIDAPFYNMFPDTYLPGCTSGCQIVPLDVEYKEHLEYPSDLTLASVHRLERRVQEWLNVLGREKID